MSMVPLVFALRIARRPVDGGLVHAIDWEMGAHQRRKARHGTVHCTNAADAHVHTKKKDDADDSATRMCAGR